MEHGKKNRKFGRESKQRGALLRSLAVALIDHGKITTTTAKAKSLRTYIEKLITRSKTVSLGNIRYLVADLDTKRAKKLTKEIAPKLAERKGGYTRIHKLPSRSSDGARMSIIEIIK